MTTDRLTVPAPLRLKPRPARDISASLIGIGCETLDRDYADYAQYRQWLGPLGAKRARLQAGWAKCERTRGEYDFQWLDTIVADVVAQGLEPWLQLSYGNSRYAGGGGEGLAQRLPHSAEALAAWERWVEQTVWRYRRQVRRWEIWNEPDNRGANAPEAYARFYLRTSAIVRRIQPEAVLLALALAGVDDTRYARTFLEIMREAGALPQVDALTIHGYPLDPDDTSAIGRFRTLAAEFSPHLQVEQGETGAPSQRTVGAHRGVDWNETLQSTWNLRRTLGHLALQVPYSHFSMADMNYRNDHFTGHNSKGLIATDADNRAIGPKPSYYAMQHLTSIFHAGLHPCSGVEVPADPTEEVVAHRWQTDDGALAVAFWQRGAPAVAAPAERWLRLQVRGARFQQPLLIRPETGQISAARSAPDGSFHVPVHQGPTLLCERRLVPLDQ